VLQIWTLSYIHLGFTAAYRHSHPYLEHYQQVYVALAALDEEPADMETAQLVIGNALSSLAVVKEAVSVRRASGQP
jgi:hypothetical protein